MEGVLDVGAPALRPGPVHARRVRLVEGEEQSAPVLEVEVAGAQPIEEGQTLDRLRAAVVGHEGEEPRRVSGTDVGLGGGLFAPGPGVAEPEMRKEVQRSRLGSPIVGRDADGHVFRPGLRVLHDHVEVAVVVEDPGVQELELSRLPTPLLVLLHEPRVGVLGLRVLVEPLHVGVGGGRVEVVPVLLDVLPVVRLAGPRGRRGAPSGWGRARSRGRGQSRAPGSGRRSRPGRPRPSGRPCCARGRGENSPRRRRRDCSPRAPSPTSARRRTDPNAARPRRPLPRGARARASWASRARGRSPPAPSRAGGPRGPSPPRPRARAASAP